MPDAAEDQPPMCGKCGERHYGRSHPWRAIKRKSRRLSSGARTTTTPGPKDHSDPRVCQNCVRTQGSYRNTLAYVVLNARTGKYHASAGYGWSDCGLDMTGDDWWWPL